MKEDINNYSFGLKNEAERILQEPLPRLDKVLFAEVHLSPAKDGEPPQIDILQKIGNQRISDKQLAKRLGKHFRKSSSSGMGPMKKNFRTANYTLAYNDEEKFVTLLGEQHKQIMSLFV